MKYPAPPSTLPPGSVIDLYLRFSSDGQTVESQEHVLRAWAAEHHLIVRRAYKDEAKSGSTVAGREDFLRMCDDYLSKAVSPLPAAAIIWSWSRFARDVQDAEYYKIRIRYETKIQVWSLTDHIPEGEFAPVFEAFQHVQDAQFLKRLRTDTKRGLHDLARQGFASGGFPPIGYMRGESVAIGRKKNGETRYAHRWVFDPATQDRVVLAFQMRLQGKSYLEIHTATHLCPNQNNYSNMFERVTYAGAIKCGDEIFWDCHPAYITRAEHEKLQRLRKPPTAHAAKGQTKYPRIQTTYLYSGILVCGICGWTMSGNKVDGVPSYRCDWRHRQGHAQAKCTQPSIVAYALHEPLLAFLASNVFTFERMRAARERLNALLSGDRHALVERRAFLQAEQRRLTGMITRLVDGIERGGFVGELQERYLQRKSELNENAVELAELESQMGAGHVTLTDDALRVVAAEMSDTLREFATAGVSELRVLIQSTIKKAELSHDKLTLFYSPLPFIQSLARSYTTRQSVPAVLATAYPLAGAKYLGMVDAPNGLPTAPKYQDSVPNASAFTFPLEVAELVITRPAVGRKSQTVEQSSFLPELLRAIARGVHSSRLYADSANIPLARAQWHFRVAREKGLIVPVKRPGTHAGGVQYRLADSNEARDA